MPTSPLMEIPKSRSAKEFESICKDILEKKYGSRFEKYGRDGQKQNGIDMQLNELDFDKSYQIIIKINKD